MFKPKLLRSANGGSAIPFWGIAQNIIHPTPYPARIPLAWAVRAADYLALAGILLAFVLAVLWFMRRRGDPLGVIALLFSGMGFFLPAEFTLHC